MKRNGKFLFVVMLAGVFAWGMTACSDDDSTGPECGDGTCNGDETLASCPEDCDPCNHDTVCDPGESCTLCGDDCCTLCDINNMTGTDHDFLVSELFLPTSNAEADANGVDIDGDGTIDNHLGAIITLLGNYMDDDINDLVNSEIEEGGLLLASRVKESGNGDGIVAVQIFQADLFAPDATPLFEGDDDVSIPADGPDLYLCGEWDGGPDLETSPANVTIAFPLPEIGLLELTLSYAQIRTVTDPDNVEFYGNSSVTPTAMTNVMIGGGLSRDEIYGENGLIDFLGDWVIDMVDGGGETADLILGVFDNSCLAQEDIPGCEDVAPDTGNCQEDGVLHIDEIKCNVILSSALKPDVDIDGDGVDDLVSLGLRVASAVPVTLHFE